MSNNEPFERWWYYEMSKDAIRQPNQKISNGAFAVIVICAIISLILLGGFVAVCIWAFAS